MDDSDDPGSEENFQVREVRYYGSCLVPLSCDLLMRYEFAEEWFSDVLRNLHHKKELW